MNKFVLILMIPSIIGGIINIGYFDSNISYFGMIGMLGAGLIGALASTINTNNTNTTSVEESQKNRDWQEDMQEDQQNFASQEASAQRAWTERFTKEMAINGPSWEMEGAKKAGLNPYSVVNGAGSVSTASGGASASAPSVPSGSVPHIQKNDVGSIIASMIQPLSQLEVNDSLAQKNKSEADRNNALTPKEILKIQAETAKLLSSAGVDDATAGRINSFLGYEIKKIQGEIGMQEVVMQGVALDNQIKSIGLKYEEQMKLKQLGLLASQIKLNDGAYQEKVASARKLMFEGNLINYDENQLSQLKEYAVKLACYNAGISEEEYQFLSQTRDVRILKECFSHKNSIGGIAWDATQSINMATQEMKDKIEKADKFIEDVFSQITSEVQANDNGLNISSQDIINGASQ